MSTVRFHESDEQPTVFTSEQWQAIKALFSSKFDRPGSSGNFATSLTVAVEAIREFDKYFESLSPSLTGKDKEALFSIKTGFAETRHQIYQCAAAMEVRYRKFKLKMPIELIKHLQTKEDEISFKQLNIQAQKLQAELTLFHTTYLLTMIKNVSIIFAAIGLGLCIIGRTFSSLLPSDETWGTLFFILGIPTLLAGIIGFIIVKVQEYGRNPSTTVRYLEELQSQMDKLRFQFDDLKAQIVEDTPHEIMQGELDVIIDGIKELKLLCFP
ncbi:unnamed protein product [Didymodactylos carnosus]|uniref:Uncharacterized protein n=1 Tax=Didymodactylos carnosus TaxID=1234261 RepID=A0A814AEF3_9BILA|nr:unnamed protein product [Didymodactylos carnosus]CAF0911040.1 unnamed protein product [Didymodactylos carnosus]CAF3541579.1 unnamed protein product [Didymodactylos carnosus]CAF3692138.1 unnamed protein product [Didymodactylos carnosus]